jgi:hypothetical protein
MKTAYGDYRIYPSGKGYDLVARREHVNLAPKFKGGDAREVGPDDPSIAAFKGVPTVLPQSVAKSIFAKVTPVPVVQSDVMILYTKDLAQKLGMGLMPMLYNVIASANTAYADSEVAISLRLVNATMIDWPNANASDDTLDGMGGFGAHAAFFQSLTHGGATSLRNIVGADFVALLRDGPNDTGGIGNLPKNPVIYPVSTVSSSTAYSVNNFCATGCEGIVAHEIGHNMGNHHDPATIAYDSGGTVASTGVFPYSYGYYSCATGLTCNPYSPSGGCTDYARCAGTDPNDFGTVMSYFNPKLMKFSNPLLANCEPTGAPGAPRACGGSVPAPAPATTSNNALSMNNVRGAISAYRNETIPTLPGSLQFTALSYSGAEGATVTFTVSRSNGSSGAVSVNYTVTAGTAAAGTDYTAASGTLNWANGDTANKTFNVTLAADAIVEGVETFTATLSTPTGPVGVYLGYPTVANGLILEPWPIGALAGLPTDPAGWTSPASPASSVAWSIVNEVNGAPAGDPGGNSLKSGLLNFAVRNCVDPANGTTQVPCPSAVEITRSFSGGTVAFSYRVSALPFFGMLEFLVDGAVVHTQAGDSTNAANGGDTGWRFFSTTITGGNHTLQWRYRTRLGFACNGATFNGVPYPRLPGPRLDRPARASGQHRGVQSAAPVQHLHALAGAHRRQRDDRRLRDRRLGQQDRRGGRYRPVALGIRHHEPAGQSDHDPGALLRPGDDRDQRQLANGREPGSALVGRLRALEPAGVRPPGGPRTGGVHRDRAGGRRWHGRGGGGGLRGERARPPVGQHLDAGSRGGPWRRDDRGLRDPGNRAAAGGDRGDGTIARRVRHREPARQSDAHAGALVRPGDARDQRQLGHGSECGCPDDGGLRSDQPAGVGDPHHAAAGRLYGDRVGRRRRHRRRGHRGLPGALSRRRGRLRRRASPGGDALP